MSPKIIPPPDAVLNPDAFVCGCGAPAEIVVEAQPTPVTACPAHAEALRRAVSTEHGRPAPVSGVRTDQENAALLVDACLGDFKHHAVLGWLHRSDRSWRWRWGQDSIRKEAKAATEPAVVEAEAQLGRALEDEAAAKRVTAAKRADLAQVKASRTPSGITKIIEIAARDPRVTVETEDLSDLIGEAGGLKAITTILSMWRAAQ